MNKNYKVSCFGAGFVGLPTSAVLSHKNPNVQVLLQLIQFVVFDIDARKIQSCIQGKMPIFEPKLQDTMKQVMNKNLTFSHNISEALDHTQVIFLALPTPTKTSGESAGKAYDLSYTEKAVNNIVQYYNRNPDKMKDQVILVEKSTVPIGTAKMISKIISSKSIAELKNNYIVSSNPEFLAEGSAINDLMKPDRVVLGTKQENANIDKLISLYHYASQRVIRTNAASSQLSKLVANCFLAQRVSSINSIAILCEQYDSDIKEVKKCISTDTRIGANFLNSSVGFGGSCFKKDMLALIYLAEAKGLHEVANYWKAVIDMNDYRKKTFFQRVFKELNSNLKGKKLAILGTAFKKDTCDARESPAIDICKDFLVEGAILNVYDPKTTRATFISEMKYNQVWSDAFDDKLNQFNSAEQAINGAHAIVILTQWDQFTKLDYASFYPMVHKPALIFDGRNILDEEKIPATGFKLCRIGKKFVSLDQ